MEKWKKVQKLIVATGLKEVYLKLIYRAYISTERYGEWIALIWGCFLPVPILYLGIASEEECP